MKRKNKRNLTTGKLAGGQHIVCDGDLCVAVLHKDDEAKKLARIFAVAPRMVLALTRLTMHASETYPHFESPRGQADIDAAVAVLKEAGVRKTKRHRKT